VQRAIVSYIPGEIGIHEPLEDVGYYLKNWFDFLVIRAKKHEDLIYLVKNADVPIINARTNISHPCEIMGDLQFVRRYRKSLNDLKMIFVGEVTNLCMSWFEAAVKFPIEITQIAPDEYLADKSLIDELNKNSKGSIKTSNDLSLINESVDLIYTDCWPRSENVEAKNKIKELFLPYQIKNEHLLKLNKKSMFLPCPPVTRGEEVSNDAMNSPLCLNFAAKEFLLHAQNAIMETV
jgi:ornithine carbamoyltransferase